MYIHVEFENLNFVQFENIIFVEFENPSSVEFDAMELFLIPLWLIYTQHTIRDPYMWRN